MVEWANLPHAVPHQAVAARKNATLALHQGKRIANCIAKRIAKSSGKRRCALRKFARVALRPVGDRDEALVALQRQSMAS